MVRFGPWAHLALLGMFGSSAIAQSAGATCQTVDAVPSFSWHAIGDTTPDEAWDCDGNNQPDSPGDAGTAADTYLIRDNHTVFVVGDVLQDGATPGTGIFVHPDVDQSGTPGSLVADVLLMDQPSSLRLAVNNLGLVCDGRCELAGAFREVGVASPGLLPEPDRERFFQAERFIFCPGEDATVEPDCNGELAAPGDPHTVRIVFESADPQLSEALAAVAPDDVLCRFDPDPEDAIAFPDVNSCYGISGLGAGDPPYLEIDVRRGSQDPPSFPHSRRQIVQSILSAPASAGAISLCVDGSSATAQAALDREDALVGRFLYLREGIESCGDGDANPCTAERDGYKITRVDLDAAECAGGHLITVGDVRGFREDHAAGEEAWIGYSVLGPFVVMVPVEVASATPAGGDSEVRFRGPTFVEAVLFSEPLRVRIRPDASVERFAHFWLRDAGKVAGGTARPLLWLESDGAELGPGSITGARSELVCGDPCASLSWGIRVDANDTYVHDLFFWPSRHHTYSMVTPGLMGNRIERLYAGPLIDGAAPATQFLSMSGASHVSGIGPIALVRDAFCDGCSGRSASVAGWAGSIDGLMIWNAGGGTDPRAPTDNLMIVGTRLGDVVGGNVDRFVVRDTTLEASPLSLVDSRWNEAHPGEGLYNRNGFFQRVTYGQMLIDYDEKPILDVSPGLAENLGFFDVKGRIVFEEVSPDPLCHSCRLFQFEIDPFVVARRITVGFTQGFNAELGDLPNIEFGLHHFVENTLYTGLTLDGLLLTGLRNNHSAIDFPLDENFSEVTWGAGPCLFDNDVDTLPGRESLLPPTAVFGDPGFVDPESYRFDVQPGSLADQAGCGISRTNPPGILEKRWMHHLANIEPEFIPEPGGPILRLLALASIGCLAGRRGVLGPGSRTRA